jgi:DNA processing protein
LIKQGATLVTEAADVLNVLRPILGLEERQFDFAPPVPPSPEAPAPAQPPPPADIATADVMRAVLTALGPAPIAVDAIARQIGLNARAVQIALLELDLAGRIERQGQGLVALKPANAGGL